MSHSYSADGYSNINTDVLILQADIPIVIQSVLFLKSDIPMLIQGVLVLQVDIPMLVQGVLFCRRVYPS